ncbi:MAG: 4-hydroxybenzoate 3-monooxygenase [Amphritea sp.]
MHVPVVIVGAGPSGSLLAWILRQRGIESLVLERKSREYVESRIRAGVMEQTAVELMVRAGIGERLKKECMYQEGVVVGLNNEHHYIDFQKLIGVGVSVYGQSEVTKDLLGGLAAEGHNVIYDAPVTAIEGIESDSPTVKYTENGVAKEVSCDFVLGCDGFHGASRKAMPSNVLNTYEKVYPFGWLGVMAKGPQSSDVALFAHNDRGFALHSMRTPELQRFYLQCDLDEDLNLWPDDRIWDELEARLGAPGWELKRGEIFQKDVTPLRSFFSDPTAHGRLFLVGDASHIVPPTGAKGLNSAFADVSVLSAGLIQHYTKDDSTILGEYADVALARNVQTQRFSWSNTAKYHIFPEHSPFERRMQVAEMEFFVTDETAQISYAKQHTGLPYAYWPEL